jgi:alkylhydroperoxidase family enzyme
MSQRISRLEFDQLAPSVQKVLDARVKRLGYLGEFFKCSGHQPEILVPFMEMTEALKQALPDRLTELGALTVAALMANDYERNQHERLSRKLGFGEEWVAAVERLDPDGAAGLSVAERAIQRLVIRAVERRGQNVAAELDTVIGHVGPQQAVAILFLVGRYITHAIIVNALGLAPPVPSIFNESAA